MYTLSASTRTVRNASFEKWKITHLYRSLLEKTNISNGHLPQHLINMRTLKIAAAVVVAVVMVAVVLVVVVVAVVVMVILS